MHSVVGGRGGVAVIVQFVVCNVVQSVRLGRVVVHFMGFFCGSLPLGAGG